MEHEFSEDGEELFKKAGSEPAGKERLQDRWRAPSVALAGVNSWSGDTWSATGLKQSIAKTIFRKTRGGWGRTP